MFTGWLSYAGTEIVNDARLIAYAQNMNVPGTLPCDDCSTLRTSLEQDVYTTPSGDSAPWVDSAIAESTQVLGFQISSITGLGDTATRSVDQLSRDGGVVGTRRRRSRELLVVFRAYATTECALSYAAAWLSRVLRGQECSPMASRYRAVAGNFCGNEQLCMLTCCPTVPADIAKYQVTLYKTGVTEGPIVSGHQSARPSGADCGLATCELEVTFTAGDPGWYSPEVVAVDTPLAPYFVDLQEYDVTLAYSFYGCSWDVCPVYLPTGCELTSAVDFNSPPTPCVGSSSFTARYYSIPLSLTGISQWMDIVPRIRFTPGEVNPDPEFSNDYEGPTAIWIRRTDAGHPCGTPVTPCEACVELFVPTFRRGFTNVADWIDRKVYGQDAAVDVCPMPAYTRQLAPFNWPTLTCGSEMCLEFYIQEDSDSRASSVVVELQRRQDAVC